MRDTVPSTEMGMTRNLGPAAAQHLPRMVTKEIVGYFFISSQKNKSQILNLTAGRLGVTHQGDYHCEAWP